MTAKQRRILIAGALLAALGVGLGAFGAHALRDALTPVELGWWQTAAQYQMWHALALLVLAALPLRVGWPAALLAVRRWRKVSSGAPRRVLTTRRAHAARPRT